MITPKEKVGDNPELALVHRLSDLECNRSPILTRHHCADGGDESYVPEGVFFRRELCFVLVVVI